MFALYINILPVFHISLWFGFFFTHLSWSF